MNPRKRIEMGAILREAVFHVEPGIGPADLFSAICRAFPDRVALRGEGPDVSYRELDRRTARRAAWFAAQGVRPLDRVGIRVADPASFIECIIACVRIGAVYVPIDANMTPATTALAITTAGIAFLQLDSPDQLDGVDTPCLPPIAEDFREEVAASRAGASQHDDPVCIMFTSGSTGTPKGVICPLGGIVPLVTGDCHLPIHRDDTVLQISARAFDAFTWEVWGALLNGASLYLLPATWSVSDLGRLIRDGGVTAAFFTARLFDLLVEAAPETLSGMRMVSFGGEPASPWHCALAKRLLPGTQLINGYGPTENTTFTCSYVLGDGADTGEIVPIGTPKMGDVAVLLDPDSFEPITGDGVGELFVGGPGLAIGYTDPALTAQKFVTHPTLGRLFRTGDAVKQLPSGDFHYLGRRDRQVKILGHRVDLFEIERVLGLHPRVASAHLVFNDTFGRNEIVAFYRSQDGRPIERQALTDFLDGQVVEQGIPHWFEHVDQPPLKQNGKIDIPALVKRLQARMSDPGADDVIAALWKRFLHPAPVSDDTHFFRQGGDSFAALSLVLEIEKHFGIALPADYLAEHPILADFRNNLPFARQASLVNPPIAPGTKSLLILVPWLDGSPNVFEHVLETLQYDGQVVSLDLSRLQCPPASLNSIRDISRACAQALDLQDMKSVSLLGPSLGGVLSLDLAAELGAQGVAIDKVVLIDSYAPWLISIDKIAEIVNAPMPSLRKLRDLLAQLAAGKRDKAPTRNQAAAMLDRLGLYSKCRPRIPTANSISLVKAGTCEVRFIVRAVPDHGWRGMVPALRVSESEGTHLSMLGATDGPALGRHLSAILAAAD